MKSKKIQNILEYFDYELLKNPEFKEDSVREEIVVPIIKGLGYSANKPNQIIRSRNLIHPFVSIGSQKKKIYIIPDYLFEVDEKPTWILDAKSPSESIIKSKNVEQAYSYAMHPEVRARFFSLCNGKEFVLFSVDDFEPLMHFHIQELPLFWENMKAILSPENIFSKSSLDYKKDLGLHLKRLGFDQNTVLVFPQIPITGISQLDDDMFTINVGGANLNDTTYVATFDFHLDVFKQLKGKIPDEGFERLLIRNGKSRLALRFPDRAYLVDVECEVGEKLEENEKEIFLPLKLTRIIN
ncbi:type I restriction enzyme HsdR N-terminal domain-containing protein [Lutibacter sp. TH_r2]|uniref:type I restriction enzyme HsdR N-terminal domain-containing protein n=1 Tax=Lutibacter sp. TH_r2 TaxID=3082083 RepID=UPI0029542E17|nr:type I restriction enzyme HsdR N-terminal domain-containing protein [Lutibacter sp. TH_r2]MDV7188601.1 type I restriction enzyme HsdR N-terminal domain-containing protein [Lutibacter sp. TH_r2]